MKFYKSFLVLFSTALLAFILGAMYHPAGAKAQKEGGVLKVRIANYGADLTINSGHVVGFSCAGSSCYVATLE
jgi:hypothetical protein